MREGVAYKPVTVETRILFWPSFVDMLTTVLMIILLAYFLQTTLGIEDAEAQAVRQSQEDFMTIFNQRFAADKQRKEVDIKRGLDFILITFSDKILFEKTQYTLLPKGKEILSRCVPIFQQSARFYKEIQVDGHSDEDQIRQSLSYPRNNWELSAGRAISVVRFFIDAGLDPKLFSANGYAEFHPVDPSHTEEAHRKNRRIEIRIHFLLPGQN